MGIVKTTLTHIYMFNLLITSYSFFIPYLDHKVAELINSHVEAKQNALPLNSEDDERTIKLSLIFIMLLTSIVLIFFIKCFRRKRGI